MHNACTRFSIVCAMLALPLLATNTRWHNVAVANPVAAGTPPNGSYKQSCLSIGITGDTLTAVCKTKSGGFKQTKLTGFSQCIGDITNINGRLQCSKDNPPPKGSYQQTCTEVWTDGATLHATCQMKTGAWLPSVLGKYSACVGDIWNLGGFLRCNRGPPAPLGPYLQSCPDVWTVGSIIHAGCISIAGKIRFSTLSNFSECRSPLNNVDGFLTCDLGTANAPIGPYKATCRNVVFQNGILRAACLKFNSVSWQSTEISQINACRSPITSVDGFLTCDRGSANAPPGSYRQTCRNVVASVDSLSALCRTKGGAWTASALVSNLDKCLSISNDDGRLICGAPVFALLPLISHTRHSIR